jgi:hypothetical protein
MADEILSERTRTYIMVLSRTAAIPADLAHQIRVRVNQGVTIAEADRIIAALKALPARQ